MGVPRTVVQALAYAELNDLRKRQSIYTGLGLRDQVIAFTSGRISLCVGLIVMIVSL
jgi:hypothetical protein